MSMHTSVTLSTWNISELIRIGWVAVLYFFCLFFSIWTSFQPHAKRLYWLGCASLIILGTLCALLAPSINGEMPGQFAVGVWIIVIGMLAALTGILWKVVRYLLAKK